MILCVSLSPCLDLTRWSRGGRGERTEWLSGGKGVNVARVLSRLGVPALALTVAGGAPGGFLCALMAREGIPHRAVPIQGETRTVVTLADEAYRQRQLPVPATRLDEGEEEQVLAAYRELLPGAEFVLLQGFTPRPRLYQVMIREARSCGVPTWLDSYGEGLRQGLEAHPTYAAPNMGEARQLLGAFGPKNLARGLRERGADWAILTAGARGAWLAGAEEAYIAPFPVTGVNPVGSGDSLAAGFAWSVVSGLPPREALRVGCLLGALNASQWAPASFSAAQVQAFAERFGIPLPK